MGKTTYATPPDEAYEQIADELAALRTQNLFLHNAIELLQARGEEATFVNNGAIFFRGYSMALEDISQRVWGTSIFSKEEEQPQLDSSEAPF